MPSSSPNTVAMRKPASVVHSVTHELSTMGARYCHSAANTSEGAGRMVSGTASALHTISQKTNSRTVNTAGETTLMPNSRRSTSACRSRESYRLLDEALLPRGQVLRGEDVGRLRLVGVLEGEPDLLDRALQALHVDRAQPVPAHVGRDEVLLQRELEALELDVAL